MFDGRIGHPQQCAWKRIGIHDNENDPVVVLNPLFDKDEKCPVHPRDVLVQPSDWDPTTRFSMTSFKDSHVNQDLKGKKFRDLCEEYADKARIKPIVKALPPTPQWTFPDYVDRASQRANSVSQYVLHRKREYDRCIEAAVDKLWEKERKRLQQEFDDFMDEEIQTLDDEFEAKVEKEVKRRVDSGALARLSQDSQDEDGDKTANVSQDTDDDAVDHKVDRNVRQRIENSASEES